MTVLEKQEQAQLETDGHKKFIDKIAQERGGLQSWNEVLKFIGAVSYLQLNCSVDYTVDWVHMHGGTASHLCSELRRA